MTRSLLLLLAASLFLASCGGDDNTAPTGPPSGLEQRAFVSNAFTQIQGVTTSYLEIIDATQDLRAPLSGGTIFAGPGATRMRVTADKSKTLVYDSNLRNFHVVDNAQEAFTTDVPSSGALPGASDDFVILPDNNTVFASVRNAAVSGQPSGAVSVLNITDRTITNTIPVPHVRRMALSPDGKRLLAFPDDLNSLWVIDTEAKTATRVDGFDRPTSAVFTSDNTRAFVLNCGPECGGTAASVTVLDLAANTPGASVPVSAATIGLLNSNNLFVAGSAGGQGKLDIVNTGSLTVSQSGTPIGNGFHNQIALGADNKLFLGAQTCTGGCLSIVNTSNQNTVVSSLPGDVTGIQPIPDRSVVYVIQGGELVIYNTSSSQPQATQVDIVGQAFGVVFVD